MSPLAIKDKIKRHIYMLFYKYTYMRYYSEISQLHVKSIDDTINELLTTNKSISRFGDGELRWLLDDNHDSFEKSSKSLSYDLKKVLNSNNKNLIIGLPDAFRSLHKFTDSAKKYWELFFAEYGKNILHYLNKSKVYYNTSISRVYMDYKDKNKAKFYFKMIKQIWNKKNILIIEGNQSRLGVGNNLFQNANCIKRIECPSKNAFNSCSNIFNYARKFLNIHNNYITLLALGPTATILSYLLCNNGNRAIDVGHVDVEYEWYLMHVTKKINLKDRYVNEVHFNKAASRDVRDKNYYNQIIKVIH